jgi:hypothetical protein
MLNRIEQDVIPALDPSRWTCLCLKRGGADQKGNPGQKYRFHGLSSRNIDIGVYRRSLSAESTPVDAINLHL